MRKIIVTTFLTMDGVLQAPGGAAEDPANGFQWGGWQFGYPDEQTDRELAKLMNKPFDLLLGRRTYEIFSAYWPYQNDAIAGTFNQVNKYVVATTPVNTSWNHSVLISKNVVNELKQLKEQDGPDLLVFGSSVLVQTLFAHRLVDELHTWIYPITLGKGKRLFGEGTLAQEWKMTASAVAPAGIIIASYVPAGEVKLGHFEAATISEAEMERRRKWAEEEGRNNTV
ncbi:dihydrofolate reductase family protein [Niabella sp.]|uniref:dihydrofolate reductase family protein n=1 Tax=Niabella sp. TaxID=1962976 RepID=UPI002611C852|nr:dihydrofolate reductase family protein [Niabella sp.]